ncbi:MAG TPA: GNAT family N-acetyltransferase [Kofleriaceae bacterium]|nr:GNAT family N-acetyltransferase [Kofleriaceae bacterium]
MKLELVAPHSPRVEQIWRGLEDRAKPVYFLTWGWVENWLACLPALEAPQLAVINDDRGTPVAAAFLRRRWLRRHGVLPSRAVYLNTVGDHAYDEIYIEHNGLLSTGDVTLARFVEQLEGAWDELFMPALEARAFAELADDFTTSAIGKRYRLRVDREVGDHYVDLAKVRAKDYLSILGSSTRAQLRKAQRLAPDAVFEIAADETQAVAFYDELVELHGRAWQAKGQSGAFADPWFDKFHRRLVAKRFAHGEIQLVRLRTPKETLGCLYNYVSHGRVLVYQTGINPDVDKNLKPGFFTHLFAVEHNAKAGHATYDFLGGDAQYKKSLGTDETKLVWARVQRKHLRFALEDRAREWVRARRARNETATEKTDAARPAAASARSSS